MIELAEHLRGIGWTARAAWTAAFARHLAHLFDGFKRNCIDSEALEQRAKSFAERFGKFVFGQLAITIAIEAFEEFPPGSAVTAAQIPQGDLRIVVLGHGGFKLSP